MPAILDQDERRTEPRTRTSFFAVEIRGNDLYYRLVRDISPNGFCFDEKFPAERPGDMITMDFPLPGSNTPIRIRGHVVYATERRAVGVRIPSVERDRYVRLMALPPPGPCDEI